MASDYIFLSFLFSHVFTIFGVIFTAFVLICLNYEARYVCAQLIRKIRSDIFVL